MGPTRHPPPANALGPQASAVLLSTDTCFACIDEGGLLGVSWPSSGEMEEERLAGEGVLSMHAEGATRSYSERRTSCELPVALVGEVLLQPRGEGMAVVVRHVCPETRCTVLGPWDEATARALEVALRRALHLPRTLGAPVVLSAAELAGDPRRFHGAPVTVEGRFGRAFEAPSFVAGSKLIFPPGVAEPDRRTQVRAEGLWLVTARSGALRFDQTSAALYARSVTLLPWASTLPAQHPRVLGLPLPERLIELLAQSRWAPAQMNEMRLINSTGWARVLDRYLGPAEIASETLALRALSAPEKARFGIAADLPRHLDDAHALVLAGNEDGRLIALDYRRDPPEVLYVAEAHDVRGVMRWGRLAGDFDAFAESFLGGPDGPRRFQLPDG